MTLDEIKSNLCYYDKRNPNYIEPACGKPDDCYCDNCFRGKTYLAEELLTLKVKADSLSELVIKIDAFEAQREGNPQPVLLEFAWNEVVEVYLKTKESL